jgi:hypothetical protein
VQGTEFQGKAIVTDHIDAEATFDWRQSHFTKYFNSGLTYVTTNATYFDGNAIPRDPSYTGSFALTYHDHLFGDWDWAARFDGMYQGSEWDSEANIAQSAAYWRFNSVVSFTRDNLTLELWGKNLLDDQNWDSTFRTISISEPGSTLLVHYPTPTSPLVELGGVMAQPPDKREFGIRVRYKFDAGEEAPATTASYTPPPVQAVAPAKKAADGTVSPNG